MLEHACSYCSPAQQQQYRFLHIIGISLPTACWLQDLLSLATGGALSAASVQAASAPTPPSLTDASCANNPDCYYSIDWNTTQRYLFIFHLFSLLWVLQFIVGFGCAGHMKGVGSVCA